jgi:hypothetical protein
MNNVPYRSEPTVNQRQVGRNQLDDQQRHWEATFKSKPRMFGNVPSYSAKRAAERKYEKEAEGNAALQPAERVRVSDAHTA